MIKIASQYENRNNSAFENGRLLFVFDFAAHSIIRGEGEALGFY